MYVPGSGYFHNGRSSEIDTGVCVCVCVCGVIKFGAVHCVASHFVCSRTVLRSLFFVQFASVFLLFLRQYNYVRNIIAVSFLFSTNILLLHPNLVIKKMKMLSNER